MVPSPPAPSSRTLDDQPRNLLFVAFPDMSLLDLTGPQTVFWAASRFARERGFAGYRSYLASEHGGLVASAEGTAVQAMALSEIDLQHIDTIILPGAPEMVRVLDSATSLVAWLQQAAGQVRRVASVCSGAFLLAQAGLLDGRRAATHWAMHAQFRARFAAVELDRDAIFVRQDRIWTSAGVTTGIDMALALVEDDYGHDISLSAARELAVFIKRPGTQPQISEILLAQSRHVPLFEALHLWIIENLSREGLSVEQLAEQVGMSPRNFARVYKQKTGRTPAKGVEHFRLEAARRLLQDLHLPVEQIARQCGFGSEERMRLTFQRNLGFSPSEYRSKVTG
ncbi:Transcriptional regulator [Cupriavidus necator]|uniref:AraC family transcriptional regulator n=2 Tax=Cupriavidus necator (strain ATCC 17699 / DSM 428 / KCTC 22496 / NCIMB 10442 / H16 / Stanier 337) TaxID=381666 RepID=A0AAE6DKD6_CUPNH|nr:MULTISPECIES: DJ-1/PfpI family protein [Cupriavidus]QCC04583.1 AraC family transcriptional regulator [Cupriavidus necator H16]QQB79276.1 DJ-1/PfpI family protein [Cupriavidus necator]WKA43499.1 DJ-1/PfpI family protein [Cupriavidus necator]